MNKEDHALPHAKSAGVSHDMMNALQFFKANGFN
jgi:hypothetical protein